MLNIDNKEGEYYEFKRVGYGATVSIKIDRVDLNVHEALTHFVDFLKAAGYHNESLKAIKYEDSTLLD